MTQEKTVALTVAGCTIAAVASIPFAAVFYPLGLLCGLSALFGPFGAVVQALLLFFTFAS